MHKPVDIIRRRSSPGILLYDMNSVLRYANDVALELIPALKEPAAGRNPALEELFKVCNEVRSADAYSQCCGQSAVMDSGAGTPYYLRGFLLKNTRGGKTSSRMILILAEKVCRNRIMDYQRLQKEFSLTNREVEVLQGVGIGLTNKEIAAKLAICENTVKDYLKKFMKKFEVTSRTALISKLQ